MALIAKWVASWSVFYFICNWYNALVVAYAGHFIVMKLNSGKGGVGLLYRLSNVITILTFVVGILIIAMSTWVD